MKTSKEFPPNWNAIQIAFPGIAEHRPIFTYGDTIHNPFDRSVPSDIIFHESVHTVQQGDFPDVWWERYLSDAAFRLDQEIEAYGAQYAFVLRHIKNGRLNKMALASMAQALSGESYGKLLSFGEAESKIRRYARENPVPEKREERSGHIFTGGGTI